MSDRRTHSRPLHQSPHHLTEAGPSFAPRSPFSSRSAWSFWRKAFCVLVLVLGAGALGRHGLAEPLTGRSDQGRAGLDGLTESPQERADWIVPWVAEEDGQAEPSDEPWDQTELGVSETAEPSVSGEKLDTPFGRDLQGWSRPVMQLGFGFVAGFSLGYALAFFLKLSLVIVGGLLLTLFGLQYVGLVEVNWLGIQAYYDALVVWIQPRVGSFREFVVSNIPAAGMAALGLLLGLRKR